MNVKVLLIDDIEMEAEVLKILLRDEGINSLYDITFAHTFLDAIIAIHEEDEAFDLILIDYRRPETELTLDEEIAALFDASKKPKPDIKVYSGLCQHVIRRSNPGLQIPIVNKATTPIREIMKVHDG